MVIYSCAMEARPASMPRPASDLIKSRPTMLPWLSSHGLSSPGHGLMEQPTSLSVPGDQPPRSEQGEAPRSTAHAPQVGNICCCRRFYLGLQQVRFHRNPPQSHTSSRSMSKGSATLRWSRRLCASISIVISL
jgi:hypothetical protein